MKPRSFLILFALLGFAHTALCATPKWTFAISAPPYTTHATWATLLANDGSGGSVFLLVDSVEAPEITGGAYRYVGERLIWLDRNGRLLHTLTRPKKDGEFASPRPFSVVAISPSVLHIRSEEIETVNGNPTAVLKFRRVVKTARGVVFKDITPPANEVVAGGPSNVGTADTRGYFTLKTTPITGIGATHIVRYAP